MWERDKDSLFTTSAVLYQHNLNNVRHPCAFLSQSHSPSKWNYQIYDCKFLSIICTLHAWWHHIQGSPSPTLILNDYQNLIYFCTAQCLNPQQAHWSLELAEYNIQLKYVPGPKMIGANALSRCPNHSTGIEDNNANIVAIPNYLFISLIDLDLQHAISDG